MKHLIKNSVLSYLDHTFCSDYNCPYAKGTDAYGRKIYLRKEVFFYERNLFNKFISKIIR